MSDLQPELPDPAWDIVPLIHWVTLLIPLALMASWVSLGVILDDDPAPGPAIEDKVPSPKEPLDLRVRITKNGLEVFGATALVTPHAADLTAPIQLPCAERGCPDGDYDLEGLSELLWLVKQHQPAHKQLTLLPDAQIPYSLIVRTMRASQKCDAATAEGGDDTLFPFVQIKSPYL